MNDDMASCGDLRLQCNRGQYISRGGTTGAPQIRSFRMRGKTNPSRIFRATVHIYIRAGAPGLVHFESW